MTYEVYKIQNKESKKIYIGITTKGHQNRFKLHIKEMEVGSNFILHNAIRKHGIDQFQVTLLETVNSIEELKERETFWIKTLDTTNRDKGYNMTLGGDGSFGRLHKEETKSLLSKVKQIHIKLTNIINNTIIEFNSLNETAIYLNIAASRLSQLGKESDSFIWQDFKIELARPIKKEKKKKRDYTEHMVMLQQKSKEVRHLNKEEYSNKQKEAKSKDIKIVQQLSLDGVLIKEFKGVREAVKELGVLRSPIQHCLKGRNKTAYGFKWKFKEE